MYIYVARHAEAQHNLLDLAHDTSVPDVELTENGISQAHTLKEQMKEVQFDCIYVSELLRTKQTAEIVNEYHKSPIVVDSLLNDIVTGMAGSSFVRFREFIATSSDSWNSKFKNAESFNDEKDRAIKFIDTIAGRKHKCVLVITSGGIANIIYGLLYGLDNDKMFNRKIANCDYFVHDI